MCSLFHSCKYIRQLVFCILDPSKAAPFSCTSCSGLDSVRLPLSLPFRITCRHEPPRFASPLPPQAIPPPRPHPIPPHHSGGIRSLQRSVGQTLNCPSRLLENGWERLGVAPCAEPLSCQTAQCLSHVHFSSCDQKRRLPGPIPNIISNLLQKFIVMEATFPIPCLATP